MSPAPTPSRRALKRARQRRRRLERVGALRLQVEHEAIARRVRLEGGAQGGPAPQPTHPRSALTRRSAVLPWIALALLGGGL